MEEQSPFGAFITGIFKPVLQPLFAPINNFLAAHYQPTATICALLLFGSAVLLVFKLKKQYVNLDAPGPQWYYDLRLWTIVALIPHALAYIYFTKW
jgi:hypothetical protein